MSTSYARAAQGPRLHRLEALRHHADQLAELAARLHDLVPVDEPAPPGPDQVQALAARLLHRASHTTVTVRAFNSTVSAPLPLARLHARLPPHRADVRLLFPSGLLGDEDAVAGLRDLAARGAQVRLSPSALPTMAVYDSSAAVVAGGEGLTVLLDPGQVRALRLLHTAVWNQAADLAVLARARVDWDEEDTMARTLRTLGQGYTDARAARELGMSVRTYRRYVAELMNRLQAASRFQAGVRASQSGLVEPA
ncbi:DNA-binding response regulator [Kitasatospora sp. NPDC004272]